LGQFAALGGEGAGEEAQPVGAEGLHAVIAHAAHGVVEAVKVNFVLGVDSPSDIETLASDINGDGTINVLDIVLLVNIILGA